MLGVTLINIVLEPVNPKVSVATTGKGATSIAGLPLPKVFIEDVDLTFKVITPLPLWILNWSATYVLEVLNVIVWLPLSASVAVTVPTVEPLVTNSPIVKLDVVITGAVFVK